jgi:hypothetical protein
MSEPSMYHPSACSAWTTCRTRQACASTESYLLRSALGAGRARRDCA